jgi:hypothetical protein
MPPGPPQACPLFPGQADRVHRVGSRSPPVLRLLLQSLEAKFDQYRKAHGVKHVQHCVPSSTPARTKPPSWHALTQESTLLLDGPPSTSVSVVRSFPLGSLFAKQTHPSGVTGALPNKKAMRICLLYASHEDELARALNNGRCTPYRGLRLGRSRGYKL